MSSRFDLDEWRRFCAEEVRPAAREADLAGQVGASVWSGIRERGYLELFHRLPAPELPDAMNALAEACASTYWQATISSALCGRMFAELGEPALRERWIPGLASGAFLGCFAATERGSGSDPASYSTRLDRRPGGWELSGEKTRVSNAPEAAVGAVLCNAFDARGESLGLALAAVDLRSSKVARTRYGSLGLRAMGWGGLAFSSVPLGEDDVILGATMARTLRVVEWGQVIQAVCALGLARAALTAAESFVSRRPSFGRPLGEHELVRHHLDGARDEVAAAALLVRDVAAEKARGQVVGERVLIAKIFTTETAVRACQAAMRVCGGWGYSTELDVERLLRDAYGNIPAGLPNDRLRELLVAVRLGVDPWRVATTESS